jgi:hypothetical protein
MRTNLSLKKSVTAAPDERDISALKNDKNCLRPAYFKKSIINIKNNKL